MAIALMVFPGCLHLWAREGGAGSGPPDLSAAAWTPAFYPSAGFYWVCALVLTAAVAAAARWAFLWRRRDLRRRDDEILQRIDEATKSLRRELAEQKEAQSALLESRPSLVRQERLGAVGQLAAGLAHEFNNILTIVHGHASLLMDNPNLDEQSVKSLTHITEGVERTAKLIKQMLAFSRQQIMQPKPLDVQHALGQSADMFSGLLGENIALRYDIALHLPPILADAEMFQQVVLSLLVNARDASASGGEVTISAMESKFAAADIPANSERKPGRFVRLRVTDTGSGMDPATMNHLFEPFFTTKEIGKGTGLGLASVYGIVNQHHGWIEVQSRVGHGTTFDLYFPATDLVHQKPAEEAGEPDVSGGKETILVVEDEWVLRELLREILGSHGYSVLEAANGLEALQVWEANREKIDLLLTDIAMPRGVSGRDLAAKLREQDPRLPVIFSSGHSQEMIQRGEETSQGVSFLSKPYRPAQLVRMVRQALDSAPKREALTAPTS